MKLPLIVWSPAKVWLIAVKLSKKPETKRAIPPVTVAPESVVVKTPETPVRFVKRPVSPVITAPEICDVNTPLTPLIVPLVIVKPEAMVAV